MTVCKSTQIDQTATTVWSQKHKELGLAQFLIIVIRIRNK